MTGVFPSWELLLETFLLVVESHRGGAWVDRAAVGRVATSTLRGDSKLSAGYSELVGCTYSARS